MYAKPPFRPGAAGLLAGTLLAISATLVAAAAKSTADADAFPLLQDNFILLSGQYSSVTGDKAAFQTRTQNAKSGTFGIESMRYGTDISKDTNLQFEGKVMAGIEDYLGKFLLAKNDVGSFEIGYKRFRTFYDGVGGFFPANALWMPLANQMLHVDRGTFWVDGTIALPNAPVLHIRYANETRTGRKDTAIWGDSDLTGIPISTSSALNPISADRKIVPAYLQLGERRETLEASITHSLANTKFDLRLVGERINNLDT
ncbi:MAG: hypothetical protein WC378_19800, partial [Opitutaceae bacterium]